MIFGLFEQELIAYAIFGIILNFLFSFLFALYLSQNIGMEEMIMIKGGKEQPAWILLLMILPFAKMAVTLYRIAILQIYFLDRGHTHKEYWVYLTSE